jgi:hypothetical protein
MLVQVNGLPAHILLVHAVVVLVPLTALLVSAASILPQARRRMGVALPIVALATLFLVPLTTHAGEWLQARVPDSPAVRDHAELGDSITVVALALLLLSAVVWWRGRRADAAAPSPIDGPGASAVPVRRPSRSLSLAVTVVTVLVSVGAVVQVVRVGDSGARASWDGKIAATPHAVPGGH